MKKFINDESGATAIEYGLIAAAMGLMLVIVMPILGDRCFGRVRQARKRAEQSRLNNITGPQDSGSIISFENGTIGPVPMVLFLCNDLARLTLSLRRACEDCTARMIPLARQYLGNS